MTARARGTVNIRQNWTTPVYATASTSSVTVTFDPDGSVPSEQVAVLVVYEHDP